MPRNPTIRRSLPEGGDAIPSDAISLSEAYMRILARLTDEDLEDGSMARNVALKIEEIM
jgi:hypothetical protein